MLKRTPLYKAHTGLGAKMVDFGGWEMPIQYSSIIEEHLAARQRAGLFDVSHMGEITIKGRGAKEVLNRLITNDLNLLQGNKAIYTLLPNERGGVVDDLLVYGISEEEFFLVVNASNTDKDYAWLSEKVAELSDAVEVTNRSNEYGQIAVQGPTAQGILQKLTDFDLNQIRFFYFDYVEICGTRAIVSRTGYTGEDGFEIYMEQAHAREIWGSLLAAGAAEGILPVGLGARDSLRLESALPLYGHELGDDITPIEAGLKYFVKLNKNDFPGKQILEKQIDEGAKRRLVGLELVERGIPRDGCRVEKDGMDIGYVTSGAYSPVFKKGLAMALLTAEAIEPEGETDIVIRNKRVKAKIVKLPFYRKKTLK